MTRLLKGGTVVNVFTGMLEKTNILIENEKIIGVGDYNAADIIEDVSGKIILKFTFQKCGGQLARQM